ncbi:MAG: hypothetical protein JXR96_27595 [Deltaproteobacteria bacterium]|nr:hypothetical protein [Deltaproteobacteria bacterium]
MKANKTTRRAARWAAAAAALWIAQIACDNELTDAFKSFSDFAEGKNVDPVAAQGRAKAYSLRKRTSKVQQGRQRVLVDVDLPTNVSRTELEQALRDACHDDGLSQGATVIKVRAWPGQLERFGTPMGIGLFARDGHGWDGKGVGFEKIDIFLPTDLSERPSEAEHQLAQGVESLLRRGRELDKAIGEAAATRSTSPALLRQSLLKVKTFYDGIRTKLPPDDRPAPPSP